MEPIEALRRAIYLLDRDLAPAAKVRAFANAIAKVEAMDHDEVVALVEEGRITDIEGIGASTGAVITEAVLGVDGYLADLDVRTAVPIGEGSALRAALRGDCHSHTTWSDGGASVREMAATAEALGHEYLVITDHSARLTIAHGLSEERLRDQLDEIRVLREEVAPFRILTGMEVDILEDGSLDMSDAMLAELDVVVASVHSKLRMDGPSMTRRMVMAIANPNVDILGHCTGRKVGKRAESSFDADIVFAACHRFDTAVEINCRPERQDPPVELLELALEWDCWISIDTDAHSPGQLEWQLYGCDKAAGLDIEPERIINTFEADDLLDWAGA